MSLERVSKAVISNAIDWTRLTERDREIWKVRLWRLSSTVPHDRLVKISQQGDAGDADLMRTAQQHKGCVAHWSPSRGHAALVRGWK